MRLLPVIAIFVLAVLTTGTIEEHDVTQEEVVVTVDSTNLRFSPQSVTVTEGDSVRFFWSGELFPCTSRRHSSSSRLREVSSGSMPVVGMVGPSGSPLPMFPPLQPTCRLPLRSRVWGLWRWIRPMVEIAS